MHAADRRPGSVGSVAHEGARISRRECAVARRRLRPWAAICLLTVSLVLSCDAVAAGSMKWGTVLADDYDRGVAERKTIVVLFYDVTTGRVQADMLSLQMLQSAKLGNAAGSAVWSFADVSKELVARNIAKALGITTFPTLSVLKPDPDALDETSRVVGVLPIDTTEIGVLRGIERASK